MERHMEAPWIDLNPANEFKMDGLVALRATREAFFREQRDLMGQKMLFVEDAIDSVSRNPETGPMADCPHV
jgi:hypothetical protein